MKKIKKCMLSLALIVSTVMLSAGQVQAGTIYESPYVTFTPDGYGWTVAEELPYTDFGGNYDYPYNKPEYWYDRDAEVDTGIESSLRALRVGEHYYDYERWEEVPVGAWKMGFPKGMCVHDNYVEEWHGIIDSDGKCRRAYYSGWLAYCADCDGLIQYCYRYMSKDAAASITSIDMDKAYYYACPSCGHLELIAGLDAHDCKTISWNMYKVKYDNNAASISREPNGSMPYSFHMYNNATEYDGDPVTSVTHLSKNQYYCNGYVFTGWNTEPDGSGIAYVDEAEIFNLTSYDCNVDGDAGVITLYAQWRPSESTLNIDPAGGSYDGNAGITSVTQGYLTQYVLDEAKVTPPTGHTVSFDANGGRAVAARTGTMHLDRWNPTEPFIGRLINNIYTFFTPDGNVDTVTASYAPDSITLPGTTKTNAVFGGWYYDDETFNEPAGGEGDKITPLENLTLYAQWVTLRLFSEDNYVDNNKKGAVDLTWEQPDNNHKIYKIYQSTEPGMKEDTRKEITSASEEELSVSEEFSHTGSEETYTVPYTGFYKLTAYGAQGEDYGGFSGGKGGMATGTFFLQAGDVLKYTVGGQGDTETGGGLGTSGGSGGGYTRVSVLSGGVETLLLVGGGGGGATASEDGMAGGAGDYLRTDGVSEGESGSSGGGGGYVGGAAD